jgi:pimeloyl-ACP methyl ester carboxylesterase
LLIWLTVIAVVLVAAFLLGPRTPVDTRATFDAAAIGDEVEAYLAASEGKVAGIRDGLQKEIVWADPVMKSRTPLALVYIHGFSASKGELRPLPDKVAAALGANLFYTRLKGHAQDGAAMATASVNDWINDFAEAVAIGRRIGERVVVIGTSTGGALATIGALDDALDDDVAAMVLIAPNYGVQASGAWLLTQPWGRQLADLLVGPERGFEARSELHAKLWTTRYPTSALLTMAALSDVARRAPVERATAPALFVFSDEDRVVRPDLTRSIASRWGAPHEIVTVNESGDPFDHVIAGDALSPATTDMLAGIIIDWIERTVPQPARSGLASRESR